MATSPIAIAVPSGHGAIVLDMATSAIARGKILQARANGTVLPEGAALTAGGEATTDPKTADILLPLGGPKGSGLGLMFEMLASVLASAPIQARALGPEPVSYTHLDVYKRQLPKTPLKDSLRILRRFAPRWKLHRSASGFGIPPPIP